MELNKQKKLFYVLAAIFLLTLAYRIMNPFEQQQVAQLTYTGKPGEGAARAEKTDAPPSPAFEVMIALLEKPPKHSGEIISGHFFQQIPGMAPPKPDPVAEKNKDAELDFVDENMDGVDVKRDPKQVMLDRIAQLKVTGLFVQNKKRAVFFQRGKQTLVAREGDRIDGHFLVEKITTDQITLYAKKIDERIHINLKSYLAPHERRQLIKGKKQ